MLFPALTFRRFLLLGFTLAGSIALADGVARHELQMATAVIGAQVADASDE